MPSSLLSLAATTVAISASGALSPGPLSASAVAVGASLGALGGLALAVGHTLFELPYVVVLAKWRSHVRPLLERYSKPMSFAVAAFMAFFAYLVARDAVAILLGASAETATSTASPMSVGGALWTGALLTGLNPYFLLWWLTVGQPLVAGAVEAGRGGLAVMYLSHVWMDYAWLALLAAGGGVASVLGAGAYGVLLLAVSLLLAYFAVSFFVSALKPRRL
ncbi:MAG: LysE family transporter [Fervidicoccaceae archaeon]